MRTDRQTDTHTDRQTDRHTPMITIPCGLRRAGNETFVMYDNIIIHHNKVTIYTRHRHGVRYPLHISSSKVVSGQCICVLQTKQSLCGTTQIFLARKLICLGIKICKQFYTIRNNILDVKIYVLLSYNAITFT